MQGGIVNTPFLNFRASPGGHVIAVLRQGEPVQLVNDHRGWLNLRARETVGWCAARYIQLHPIATAPVDPASDGTTADAPADTGTDELGTVTATHLNFRHSPRGRVMGVLTQGQEVAVLAREPGWLKVSFGGKTGYVSDRYVRLGVRQEPPPPATHQGNLGFRIEGSKVYTAQGTYVGKQFKKGLFNSGYTRIAPYLEAVDQQSLQLSPSQIGVMTAVSENEGKFEAINTWDNAFLSVGLFQWTAGTGSDAGELAALLWRFKDRAPEAYQELFGVHGLEVQTPIRRPNSVERGYLVLNGTVLGSSAQKTQLRAPLWAYRCLKAGKTDAFRNVQLSHAVSRLDAFYTAEGRRIRGHLIADYVTSEYGVAQLLDQHVNRPAHVYKVLSEAIEQLDGELDVDHPQEWGDDDERTLLARYLELRKHTSMTHGEGRAQQIRRQLARGVVSDARHSYVGN